MFGNMFSSCANFCNYQTPENNPINLPKVKFFIYGAILMKFETQHLYMFTDNNWDWNLWIAAALPCREPPPPLPSKSQILYIWCDFAEIWNGTFSYVNQ